MCHTPAIFVCCDANPVEPKWRTIIMTRNTTRRLVATLAAGFVAAVALAETPSPSPMLEAAGDSEAAYLLQPGDVVEISVWHEEKLTKQVLVRPDGGLSFPLAGNVKAAGRTPADIELEIQSRLEKFYSEATVTVSVVQASGNQVYVVGKVSRPGSYRLERAVDVMQVLSLAGGALEFANVDDIRIIRRGADGRQSVFEFRYSAVARGRDLEQNMVLKGGDTVVVP